MNKTNATRLLNNLPIYETLSYLTPKLSDIVNVFILPSIAFYSVITNLICLIVFSDKTLFKNQTYKYFLFNSIFDIIYSFINLFVFIMRCGTYCDYGYSYWIKMYEIYAFHYIARAFEVSCILVDIKLGFIRLMAFSNNVRHKDKIYFFKLNIIAFILVGFIIMAPSAIVAKEVKHVGYLAILNQNKSINENRALFMVITNSIGNSSYSKYVIIVMSLVKGVILLNVLLIINLTSFLKLRIHIRQRKNHLNGTNNNKLPHKELKATLFIILHCLWRYVGDIQNSIAPIMFLSINSNNYSIYTSISNCIQWTVSFLILFTKNFI